MAVQRRQHAVVTLRSGFSERTRTAEPCAAVARTPESGLKQTVQFVTRLTLAVTQSSIAGSASYICIQY